MKSLALTTIARWCEAELLGENREISAVDIDSRQIRPGSLFVALPGLRHDGHQFAAAAVAAGAKAVLARHRVDVDAPQLLCADTERALGALAAAVAGSRATRVIGITGSNGKTTVKTLTHAIVSLMAPAYANPGNRNNEIGLPLALLDQPEDAAVAVYEMGAGKPGDIAYLATIARPAIALVNNVGSAHLERMGSQLGVAQTKGAIYQALPPDGIAVINADDAFGLWFAEQAAPRRVLRFGLEASAEATAKAIDATATGSRFRLVMPDGEADAAVPLPGRHNVMNALAAATLAWAAGATLETIVAGLANATAPSGRFTRHVLRNGAVVIDDSYNANPGSVTAAIATLMLERGERWLVLGDMAELGADAEGLHAEIGKQARSAGISRLFTVGTLSQAAAAAFGNRARHFPSQAELMTMLEKEIGAGVTCLVKGSRSSAMDRVVSRLRAGKGSAEVSHAA